jgi:hypothetical protein
MQEHIKRLAVEAGAAKFYPDKQSTTNDAYLVGERFLQRFAQSAARECAQAADEALTKGRSPMGQVAAEAIRARFGLE